MRQFEEGEKLRGYTRKDLSPRLKKLYDALGCTEADVDSIDHGVVIRLDAGDDFDLEVMGNGRHPGYYICVWARRYTIIIELFLKAKAAEAADSIRRLIDDLKQNPPPRETWSGPHEVRNEY